MQLLEYLKLCSSGIRIHKKRTFQTIFITGIILCISATLIFVLQGIENTILDEMTSSTDHKIFIKTSIESEVCNETCNIHAERQQIEQNIKKYNGKIIRTKIFNINNHKFYTLKNTKLLNSDQNNTSVPSISAPIGVIADLISLKIPNYDENFDNKTNFIKKIYKDILHQKITTKTGEQYYISNILPSRLFAPNLALSNLNIKNSLLDIIFSQLDTSSSINIIERETKQYIDLNKNNNETKNLEEDSTIFAEFDNIESVAKYYHSKENYCTKINHILGNCNKAHKYYVEAVISDPLSVYEKFQNIWSILKVSSIILSTLLIIITICTYTRIITKEEKVISLYQAMRATKVQITTIFTVHLLLLCIATIILSLILAVLTTVCFNIINKDILQKTLMIGLSINVNNIFIIGWNSIILIPIISLVLSVFLTVIINNQSFSSHKIAQQLKN